MCKIEPVIMLISILVLCGLAVRADIETDIQAWESQISNLQEQTIVKTKQIKGLQEQLKPLEYASPLKTVRVSSATGIRVSPMGGGTESLHHGVDLRGKKGDSVYAVLAGRVVENWLVPGWYNGIRYRGHPIFGGYIVIEHGNQLYSIYGHLSKTLVHEGKRIIAGDKIGEVGNTGISTGNHLHFEVVINPFKYLRERK